MAKTRVYELAKELGVESKTVLSTLKDMGEFVRSASSTIEPPVERRLKEKFGSDGSASKPAAKSAAASRPDHGASESHPGSPTRPAAPAPTRPGNGSGAPATRSSGGSTGGAPTGSPVRPGPRPATPGPRPAQPSAPAPTPAAPSVVAPAASAHRRRLLRRRRSSRRAAAQPSAQQAPSQPEAQQPSAPRGPRGTAPRCRTAGAGSARSAVGSASGPASWRAGRSGRPAASYRRSVASRDLVPTHRSGHSRCGSARPAAASRWHRRSARRHAGSASLRRRTASGEQPVRPLPGHGPVEASPPDQQRCSPSGRTSSARRPWWPGWSRRSRWAASRWRWRCAWHAAPEPGDDAQAELRSARFARPWWRSSGCTRWPWPRRCSGSSRWRRSRWSARRSRRPWWPWRHPGCVRSRRGSGASWSQVEASASSRVRPDAGSGDRWRTRPPG